MGYFLHIEQLQEFESQEEWEQARALLYAVWSQEKSNGDKLIRLFSQCWYVLSLWDCCMPTDRLSYEIFQNTLLECAEFGIKNHAEHSRFLCMAGYMMSTLPYLFYANGTKDSFTEWECRGIAMLCRAYELDASDRVAELLHLGVPSEKPLHNTAIRMSKSELRTLFPGETAIELYFKDILKRIQ